MMNMMKMMTNLFRPVLSDETIIKYYKKGLLIETPIDPKQIQPNSVDLTLGKTFKRVLSNDMIFDEYSTNGESFIRNPISIINPVFPMRYESDIADEFIIKPGEFMLLASNEILNIPNGIISFVQGRSSVARIGIQTEQAGLIDSGFRGTITFEVYNESQFPVKLYPGMRVAQVYFFKAQYAKIVYGKEKNSKYSGQIEATGSRIDQDPELLSRK